MKPVQDGPFLDALGLLFALLLGGVIAVFVGGELAHRRGRTGRLARPLNVDQFVGWICAGPFPIGIVWWWGDEIVRSQSGYWTPGEFRSSEAFVVVCWAFILGFAPFASLVGILSLRKARRRD